MATKIGDLITLDGTFLDWPAVDMVMTAANTVAGYQVYGALLNDATLGETYVIGIDATVATDPVIAANTFIYLNTDQNTATGFSPFGSVGAEDYVQFSPDTGGVLQPYLYSVTSAGVTTQLNGGAPLEFGISSDGRSVELAIAQALLTPVGGAAPTSINFATLVDNGVAALPSSFTGVPQYIIADPAAAVPPVTIGNLITLDGTFSEWPTADMIMNAGNFVAGYQVYGALLNDATLGETYVIGIDATVATDPVIAANTFIYLNTDQNTATGYSPFGSVGAEYYVQFSADSGVLRPYLYSVTSTGVAIQLNGGAPLDFGISGNGESLEVAIAQASLTPTGAAAPTSINFTTLIDNGVAALPGDFTSEPQYTITDPATLLPATPTHRVAIVYSDTSASLYFSPTAYSDLFMAAQNQARMAGVSYDVIDESQLTNINNLIGYDALIFPSMPDVNTAQLPAIMSTLTSAVYNYHIDIITSGDFLTNDQTGAALPGNSYANMETLLGLARYTGGNSGDITITANDVSNPIMQGYTAGQTIQSFTGAGYAAYQGVGGTTVDTLVNQNVTGVGTLPGVVQTTTGGTNVHFATQDLLGDSNLLSHAIQSVVLGTQPGLAMHITRDAGVVAARMDMDQSQFVSDVSPVDENGLPLPGIYDKLLPILQQWNQQYDFVGSFYINIGDTPNIEDPRTTDWTKSLSYYHAIQAMGSEIGNHSYTHLLAPPTATVTATTTTATPAHSIQVTLDTVPSFAGVTVGMMVTGLNLGEGTPVGGGPTEGVAALANTLVTAVSGNTLTLSYVPGGYGTPNEGVVGDIPAGTTLTFHVPEENTNFLQTGTGTVPSSVGNPFTFDYEFNQSKLIEQQQLGTIIYGAAVPGATEMYATSQNILPYYQSAASIGTTPGYTGYLTGGWTGIGSGYPSAIGYMSPTSQGSLYIAPNITFDFTEVQYQGKTVQQAAADWAAQISDLAANASGTPIFVWPIHDYGAAAWDTSGTGAASPFTTQLYTDFIAQAYANDYEFVTLEDLASRVTAQEKAHIDYTTTGDTIAVTVTPDPMAPDLGEMALNVVNDGTQLIQSIVGWYAYDNDSIFLPTNGGTYTVNLGTMQDDVTHIAALPMRGDLLSVSGDGSNLSFAMVGSGNVLVDLKGIGTIPTPTITGADFVGLVGDQLQLALNGLGEHDVTITLVAPPPTEVVSTVAFSADTGASATDLVTNIADQTITGTLSAPLAAGDVVKVSLDNGATWLAATAATGATTFSLAGVTLTASNTLIARVENSQGVASTPLSQAYVFDTVLPIETATIFAMTDDSGVAGDFITNNGAAGRTVSGTLSVALGANETLEVSSDGGTTWTAATVAGTTWSATDGASHVANWTIEAQVVDLAGNPGPFASQVVTFDTTPPAAPSTPDLSATSDSGVSNTDNLTKVTTPTFAGTADPGSTVTLFVGTTAVGTGTADAVTGAWSFATTTPLANGINSVTAKATDVAGNVGAPSGALPITIDATPPVAPSTPDLTAASDNGVSSTDNITSITTPTFTGNAEAGSTVTLFDGTTAVGTAAATGGKWTITSTLLAGGVHSITATSTDAAGNISVASNALPVTIATTVAAPSTPDMTAATDKGASNTDNNTNDSTPTFTGTALAASTVTLLDGTTVIGTGKASAAGVYTITPTATSKLADGTHSITATTKDQVGNISAPSAALSVVIDTVAPGAPSTPDLTDASDTGVSNTDNLTNNKTPTFSGTAEVGSTVTLFNGAAKVGTAVATDGTWSITTTSLANGVHSITTKATDVAGNVSVASAALSITIDTTVARPARPDLIATSDRGVSSTDNITNLTTPTFTGTAAAGSTVALLDGTTVLATGSVTGGSWTITDPTPLAEGVHSITVQATDVVGNISAASAALSVTIDATPPNAPAFSGGNATTLKGTGEAGDTVTVLNGATILGSAKVGAAGNWSMSFAASASPRSVTAFQTDKAGNAGPAGGPALIGTSGADTIASTPGNNFMIGGAGVDTFSFSAPFGNDVIANFVAAGGAHDFINFHDIASLNSFANVKSHAEQVGSGVVINDGSGDTLTLNNVTLASLTTADFRFV